MDFLEYKATLDPMADVQRKVLVRVCTSFANSGYLEGILGMLLR